jgi:hypothetical protein
MTSPDLSKAFVEAALATARIAPSPDEVETIIGDYPKLREIADALFEFGDDLEPALTYDPLDYYPAAK